MIQVTVKKMNTTETTKKIEIETKFSMCMDAASNYLTAIKLQRNATSISYNRDESDMLMTLVTEARDRFMISMSAFTSSDN